MLGDWFWNYLFNSFTYIVNLLKTTAIISWTDDAGASHTISFFAVLVSYLIVQVIINVVLFFNNTGVFDGDDD